MPRRGRRHWMTTAACTLAVLALPAAAQAATYVVTGGAATNAVQISSNGVTPTTGSLAKGLLIESSVLQGGAVSINAKTECLATDPPAGDIAIVGHHVTTASPTGILVDASNAAR